MTTQPKPLSDEKDAEAHAYASGPDGNHVKRSRNTRGGK